MTAPFVTITPDDLLSIQKALTIYFVGLQCEEERDRVQTLIADLTKLSHCTERPEFRLEPSGGWN